MISGVKWVRKGAASRTPEKADFTDEEFERIQHQLGTQLSLAEDDLTQAQQDKSQKEDNEAIEDSLAEFKLDEYDKENDTSLFSNVKGLAYYSNNEEDPYLVKEQDEEELEELVIEETDNLLLVTKTEDDVSFLEVYVYEEQEDNMYVHHDILLPTFPLCLEWIGHPFRAADDEKDANGTGKGNFVAIGTFDPHIEIWDLDTIDPAFPQVILGQIPDSQIQLKTKGKSGPARVAKRVQAERHIDAVMSLSWNKTQTNLIASGSADTTIKLWDVNNPENAAAHYTHHTDKVQVVEWNFNQPTVMLSAGYDKKATVFDSRDPTSVLSWSLTADAEAGKWDPHNPERFFISSEDGIVKCFDGRKPGVELFTIHAHDREVSALDINPHVPNMLVTGGSDKMVKVWSLQNDQPVCIVSRNIDVGKVFTCSFCVDSKYRLAVGGSQGPIKVWNLGNNSSVRRHFPMERATESRLEFTTLIHDEEPESDEEIEQADDAEFEDEEMNDD